MDVLLRGLCELQRARGEDFDFGFKASEKGFSIIVVKNVMGLDINIKKVDYSDIYVDMPLNMCIKGLPKKARTSVLGSNFEITFNNLFFYYRRNKRYLFYLVYPLIIMISIYGFIINNLFYLMCFPIYISFYTILQVNIRGLKKGLKMAFRSIIAGIPYSYLQLYYFAREMVNARVYDNLDPHSDQNG